MAEKRPTILQIIPELDTGGAELSTIEMAGAIVKAGGRALVLSEGGRMAARIAAVGAEFVPFAAASKNPARIAWNGLAIARLAKAEGADLIHARSRAPAWSALLAARRARLPFVTTYHGAYNEKTRLKNLYNSVMARADVVIANSGYTAGLIKSRYGTPDDKIRIIYRGVDLDRFDPAKVEVKRVARLRAAWDATPDERLILNPGRLTAWKGQAVVIAAARRLAAQGRLENVAVILAGDDQGRAAYAAGLKAEVAAAGLQDKVRLVGHCDDMPAAFLASHLAVVASIQPEAFGRAAAEAQAMGCPVVSTDIGAPPETVLAPPRVAEAERTGWLVPPGDAERLAAVLAEGLAMSPEQHAAMAMRARRHVTTSFTTRRMQLATLKVYDDLLGTGLEQRFQQAC